MRAIQPRVLTGLAALDALLSGLLRGLAFSRYRAVAALVVLGCLLYLPGISSFPVTDRDEARFAQASKQMLETGNYIDIRFQSEPRYKKPIGIYWLQSAAVKAAQAVGAELNDIWAYRIPSFLGALAAVLLLFWAARPVIGREAALIAAGLFASCLTLALEARIAKSDAALIATVMAMQGALFRLYLSPPAAKTGKLAALFWIATGISILIKGPVGPAVSLLTAVVVLWRDRDRAWLKHLHWKWGVPVMLLITLPWFIAIGIQSGGAFFQSSLGQDFAGKLTSGQERHWGPPGFYFLLFWVTFWPGSLFITVGAVMSLWYARASRRVLFLLGWIVPYWLMIELIPTKLPHYALPLFPAFAIIAALMVKNAWLKEYKHLRRWRLASVLWGFIVLVHILALLGLGYVFDADDQVLRIILAVAYFAAAQVTLIAAWRAYPSLTAVGAVVSAVIFYNIAFVWGLPNYKQLWMSERGQEVVKACGSGRVALSGYTEPSTVFLNGTDSLLTSPAQAAQSLASGDVRLVMLLLQQSESFESTFKQSSGGTQALRLGCVDGFNINGGKPTRVYVYANSKTPLAESCKALPQLQCQDKKDVRWRQILDSKF